MNRRAPRLEAPFGTGTHAAPHLDAAYGRREITGRPLIPWRAFFLSLLLHAGLFWSMGAISFRYAEAPAMRGAADSHTTLLQNAAVYAPSLDDHPGDLILPMSDLQNRAARPTRKKTGLAKYAGDLDAVSDPLHPTNSVQT